MRTLADWTWCRCWLPLLGAIAGLPLLGDRGTVGVHVGGLDGVSLALLGCHCWAAIAGDIGGGVGAHVGGLDVVPLLGGLDVVTLLGAIAGLPLLGIEGGVGVYVGGLDVVPLLACWVPLLGIWGGVDAQVGGLDVVPLLGAIVGAMAGCHCSVPCRMLATWYQL